MRLFIIGCIMLAVAWAAATTGLYIFMDPAGDSLALGICAWLASTFGPLGSMCVLVGWAARRNVGPWQ